MRQFRTVPDKNPHDIVSRCPTYGYPRPGNLYGRRIRAELQFLAQYRPDPAKGPPTTPHQNQNPLAYITNEHPSIAILPDFSCSRNDLRLYFSTLHCSFRIEPAVFSDDAPDYLKQCTTFFTLRDSSSKVRGLAQLHQPPEPTGSSEIEVLVLSFAAPGSSKSFPIDKVEGNTNKLADNSDIDSGAGEEVAGEWHSWDCLNVLLVRRMSDRLTFMERMRTMMSSTQLMERVGVGVIYKSAIERALAPASWMDVALT